MEGEIYVFFRYHRMTQNMIEETIRSIAAIGKKEQLSIIGESSKNGTGQIHATYITYHRLICFV